MTFTEEARPLHISHSFKADRDRIFAAFTSLESMRPWFGPPECRVGEGQVDFRIGGAYRIQIKTPDGDLVASGTYREIVPPQKIVFTWRWEDDEDWVNLESIVTLEFHAKADGSELELTQVGFPNADSRNGHEGGWAGSFEKLDASLSI